MNGPLQGITVIEARSPGCSVSVALALAFCTRIAASLGAQVHAGAWTGDAPHGPTRSLSAFLGVDKGSPDAPGTQPSSERLAASTVLVADSDFIDACPTDTLPPILVSLSARAYPCADRSSEFTLMARSGILDLIGDPARSPLPLPGHQPAYAAGLAAYTGLAAALLRIAQAPGAGERVDVNILDTLLWLNWKSVLSAAWHRPAPRRHGRLGEWPMLRCADGWMALVFRDVDWPALKKLVSDERLDDPRYATRKGRQDNRTMLFDIVEEMFARHSRAELTTAAMALRIPLGPVLAPHELRQDAQYQARQVFETVDVGHGSVAVLPKLPVRWTTGPVSASQEQAA